VGGGYSGHTSMNILNLSNPTGKVILLGFFLGKEITIGIIREKHFFN